MGSHRLLARSVPLAVAALALATACGSGPGRAATTVGPTAGSITTASTAMSAPTSTAGATTPPPAIPAAPTSPDVTGGEPTCAGGTELGTAVAADGRPVAFVESNDHRLVCVGGTPDRPELTFNLDPDRPPTAESPHPSNGGGSFGLGLVWSILLPDGYPRPATVRNERGDDLGFVMSLDGRQLLVLETDVDTEAAPPAWVPRTFVVVDGSGVVIDRLVWDGPPIADAPVSPLPVLACLRDQGLRLPAPGGMATPGSIVPAPTVAGEPEPDPQPYEPAVARAAWDACRDLARASMVGTGMSAPDADKAMTFLDCMAARGWIQMFRSPTFDADRHDLDARACTAP